MANANNNQTIGSSATTIFQCEMSGGSDRNGVTAITVTNGDSAEDLHVNVTPHHSAGEWGLIPAGKSATFTMDGRAGAIDTVQVKRAGSTDVTPVSWMVTSGGDGLGYSNT